MKTITVYSRNKKSKGHTTGGEYSCQMEGCKGKRMGVRWNDGKITFPCTEGMKWINEHTAQII